VTKRNRLSLFKFFWPIEKVIEIATETSKDGRIFVLAIVYKEQTNLASGQSYFHNTEHDKYSIILSILGRSLKAIVRIK
jgi:hypothetical protein